MKRLSLYAAMAVFLLPSPSFSETGPLGWGKAAFQQSMETDRPDFTEGTQTVQSGHAQIELGYTFVRDDENGARTETHSVPEALLRLGLGDKLEARLSWEGYINQDTNQESVEGVSDFSIGFKQRLYEASPGTPAVSLLGSLSIPTGSSELSSDEVDPFLGILWAYDLKRFAVAGNINFGAPNGKEGRYFEVGSSISLATSITDELGIYVEYFGIYPAESVPENDTHSANTGLTYAVTDNLQLDARFGLGLNNDADDFFTGAGLAVRL